MKIQLEQLDLLKPWPAFVLREGYYAMRVLVRIGTIPVGEVAARPARARKVSHKRLARRIVRHLTFPLLKMLARQALTAGPDAIAPLDAMTGTPQAGRFNWRAQSYRYAKKILQPGGLIDPWPALCAAAAQNDPYLRAAPSPASHPERTREGSGSQLQRRDSLRSTAQNDNGQSSAQNDNARETLPPVTIAVCTRNRAKELQGCIEHLVKLDYPDFEILICDNSEDPKPARQIATQLRVNYTREPIAGLSRARNSAIAAASHRWIAFTDDDCRPEPNWLRELVRPLSDTRCRCVTGLVLPAQLENSAEITFEIYGGLGRGFAEKTFDPSLLRFGRWAPARTWNIGAGANMLLDAEFVKKLGGYDIDMGPGGVGGCGEDTLIFYQILARSYNIHYAPRAIVHHFHRSSDEALRRQIYSYAAGHAAYHMRCLISYRDHRSLVQLVYHLPRWFARNFRKGINARTKYPFTLVPIEIKGTIAGAFDYAAVRMKRKFAKLVHKILDGRTEQPQILDLNTLVQPPIQSADLQEGYDVQPVNKSFRAA